MSKPPASFRVVDHKTKDYAKGKFFISEEGYVYQEVTRPWDHDDSIHATRTTLAEGDISVERNTYFQDRNGSYIFKNDIVESKYFKGVVKRVRGVWSLELSDGRIVTLERAKLGVVTGRKVID